MFVINKRTKTFHDTDFASDTCALDAVEETLLTRQEEKPVSVEAKEGRMKMCTYCCARSGEHGKEKNSDGRCTICFGVVREAKPKAEPAVAAEGEAPAEKPKRTRKAKAAAEAPAEAPAEGEASEQPAEGETPVGEPEELPLVE